MVLLLGVDRFMSEARAITNTIGNGVGTMAIAKWVGALDKDKMNRALNGEPEPVEGAVAVPNTGGASYAATTEIMGPVAGLTVSASRV